MIPSLLAIAAGVTLFCILSFAMVPLLNRPGRKAERLTQVLANNLRGGTRVETPHDPLLHLMKWSKAVRSRFGIRENAQTREKLYVAGLRSEAKMDLFRMVQWISPLAGLFAGSFLRSNPVFACALLAAAGYLLPDIWLRRHARAYKEKIRRSLPDTLDLLNICVEAGLGLDQAMLRVSDELALSHPELHAELHRVQLEQRAGSARLDAWKRLAARADIEEISSFVSMLSQSERFGTPIARALSRFADDLRTQRRQHAEEAAAKTRVKIVFPLVFFIFPCLFLVLLAPAVIALIGALKDFR